MHARLRCLTLIVPLFIGGCSSRMLDNRPSLNVAEAALSGGSPQVALQVAEGILERSPNDTAALTVKGDALTSLGRLDEAASIYETAVRDRPPSGRALVGLGRVKLTTDPAAAELLFLRALEANPRDTTALNNLGIARDLTGNHAGAQEVYRKALGINPDLTAAQVNMALSLALGGQGDAALRAITPKATELGASRKMRHDYAAILAMAGRRAEAERILAADLTPAEVKQALDAFADARGRAARPAESATPVAEIAAATGIQVQISAAATEDQVNADWQRLLEHLPQLMGGRRPLITRADRNGQVVWRLRTGGFSGLADARAFCGKLRAAQTACFVDPP